MSICIYVLLSKSILVKHIERMLSMFVSKKQYIAFDQHSISSVYKQIDKMKVFGTEKEDKPPAN